MDKPNMTIEQSFAEYDKALTKAAIDCMNSFREVDGKFFYTLYGDKVLDLNKPLGDDATIGFFKGIIETSLRYPDVG